MSTDYSDSSSGQPAWLSNSSPSAASPPTNGPLTNGTSLLTNGTTMVNGYSTSSPSPPPAPQPLPTISAGSAFMQLVPPINFACVEEGLFRSGQPSSINLCFLSELNLKTIVWLAVEEPNESLLAFADDNELTIHHLGIAEGGNPWDPLTEQCVIDALHHIVDSRNYPLLISCGMGRHRTGTVVGCLRRLQRWNLASALEEYRRFTGSRRSRVVNELHIEAFQRDSVFLPPAGIRPSWLNGV